MNDGAVLRQYFVIARRQWWVVLQAVIIVAAVAGYWATRAPDNPYQSTATLLVQTDSPANTSSSALDILVATRARSLLSLPVLEAAAKSVPGETAQSIAAAARVSADSRLGTLNLVVSYPDPTRPSAVANAVANAFINDQQTQRTAGLRQRADQIQSQLNDLEARIADLDRQTNVATFQGKDTSTFKASRDATLLQYQSLFTSQQQTLSDIQLANPGVQLVFPPVGATQQANPSPVNRALLGAVVGLMIGIALAALREILDTRIRDRTQAEALTGWTVLAELPDHRIRTKRRELPAFDQPEGALAEAMRGLRTNLRFLGAHEPLRCIVVTSPQPGDGKTTTAANLAVSLALTGVNTVLVSGDLREPTLDDLFVPAGSTGLSEVLIGSAVPTTTAPGVIDTVDLAARGVSTQLEAALHRTGIPNLRMLPAGMVPPNPAELLSSERAAKVFAELCEVAEMVVVDSPPTVFADSALLAGLADGVLLVVSRNRTKRRPLADALTALGKAPVRTLGVVLNRTKLSQSHYGHYAEGRRSVRKAQKTRKKRNARYARAAAQTAQAAHTAQPPQGRRAARAGKHSRGS